MEDPIYYFQEREVKLTSAAKIIEEKILGFEANSQLIYFIPDYLVLTALAKKWIAPLKQELAEAISIALFGQVRQEIATPASERTEEFNREVRQAYDKWLAEEEAKTLANKERSKQWAIERLIEQYPDLEVAVKSS